jgi:hypothetical protein
MPSTRFGGTEAVSGYWMKTGSMGAAISWMDRKAGNLLFMKPKLTIHRK